MFRLLADESANVSAVFRSAKGSVTVEPATVWEKVACSRWGRYVTAMEREAILRAHELAGTPSTVLEIGCEGGRWSMLLSELGWSPTCVDIDPNALAVCQARLPQAQCMLTSPNVNRLPAEDGSMGLVLLIEVRSVVESSWFPREANRVLRSDGVIVGVSLNRTSLRALMSRAMNLKGGEFYSKTYLSVKQRFLDDGFSFVHEIGFCWSPFSRSSDSPLIPPCVALERISGLRRVVRWSPWVVFIARKSVPAELPSSRGRP